MTSVGQADPVAGSEMGWHSMLNSANTDSAYCLTGNLLPEMTAHCMAKLLTQV